MFYLSIFNYKEKQVDPMKSVPSRVYTSKMLMDGCLGRPHVQQTDITVSQKLTLSMLVKHAHKGTQKGRIKNISSKNDDINVNNSCDDSDDSVSLLNENPAQCYGCQKNDPRQKMVFVVIFASTGSALNALNL